MLEGAVRSWSIPSAGPRGSRLCPQPLRTPSPARSCLSTCPSRLAGTLSLAQSPLPWELQPGRLPLQRVVRTSEPLQWPGTGWGHPAHLEI